MNDQKLYSIIFKQGCIVRASSEKEAINKAYEIANYHLKNIYEDKTSDISEFLIVDSVNAGLKSWWEDKDEDVADTR